MTFADVTDCLKLLITISFFWLRLDNFWCMMEVSLSVHTVCAKLMITKCTDAEHVLQPLQYADGVYNSADDSTTL